MDLLQEINSNLSAEEQLTYLPEANGEFHHFKRGNPEKSSSHIWVIGYEWEYKGNAYFYYKVGDWRNNSVFVVKSYKKEKESKQSVNYAKKKIEEVEEVIKDEKEKRHLECKNKWEPIFNSLQEGESVHPYLIIKKAKSNYRARVRNKTTLLIPIEHPGFGFVGVQQIFRNEKGSFSKYFSKGIRISGSFSRVSDFDIKSATKIYITEGFATGLSVFRATSVPTITCFTCNNIIPVIASIRKVNKSVKIIIAADNDHQNPDNPGRKKAAQAAKQFSNVIYRLPKFEKPENNSDFNDLHISESIEKVAEQLIVSNAEFANISPLGHREGNYYYVNTQTNEIFSLTAANHNENNLMAQAPRNYWGQKSGYKKQKDGSPTKDPDWKTVNEDLFLEQRDVGFFDNEKIRGIGAWIDNKKHIFNTGSTLIHENLIEPISDNSLNTKFIYEAKKDIGFELDRDLNREQISQITKCFSSLAYKNNVDKYLLPGVLPLLAIPALIDWRPNTWITGPRGSGKTTVLQWVSELIFNNGNGIVEDPTQAALRQMNDNNSVCTLIDEAEPNSKESRQRLNGIMALARQCSSRSGSKIIRGTATGKSVSFDLNSIFMFCSIQPSINNAADVSRFSVIELEKGDPANFPEMQKIAVNFESWKMPFLATVFKNASQIISNQKIIRSELLLLSTRIDARQADQLSWLFAGYWFMEFGNAVDIVKFEDIFHKSGVDCGDYVNDNEETDDNECLSVILSTPTLERNTIEWAIKNEKVDELFHFGIKVLNKCSDSVYEIFFSARNTYLRYALKESEWQDYGKIMKRSPDCISKRKDTRLGSVVKKGFVMRLNFGDSVADISQENEDSVPF